MHGREECEAVVMDNGVIGRRPGGVDGRLRDVVRLAQEMAAAHTPQEAVGVAAEAARRALDGGFAAISMWERERGRLRVLVNVGELMAGEEPLPEDESYPVHDFPEIAEFLHDHWAAG
ncbi:diguanylate cyclase, partial [Streptomyces sp. SID8382]|nr:diguanylate cyclase [Streptomyces sp. SID8382]